MTKLFVQKFHAPWCASCKGEAPRVALIAEHYQVPLVEVNVEKSGEVAQAARVRNLPTYVVLDQMDHREVGRAYNVTELEALLELNQ